MSDITRAFLDRFVADFNAVAASCGSVDSFDLGWVRSINEPLPNESEARFSQRCNEVFRAYRFVMKNETALMTLEWLKVDQSGGKISLGLLSTLYLFFCGSESYAETDPPLELVINAAANAER